jgi:hypothetical protein
LPVIVPDKDSTEPAWISAHYIPSTWPAAKAPHGFLSDGRQAFFDLFGMKYTFVDFPEDGKNFCGQGEKACNSSQVGLSLIADIWDRKRF